MSSKFSSTVSSTVSSKVSQVSELHENVQILPLYLQARSKLVASAKGKVAARATARQGEKSSTTPE